MLSSKGNHWCTRDYGSGSNPNPYHYSNTDGSYYYSNADVSRHDIDVDAVNCWRNRMIFANEMDDV